MRTLRRLLLPAILAAAALAAAGCFPVVQSVSSTQPEVGGPVEVTTVLCQGNNTTNGDTVPVATVCDPAPGDPSGTANTFISDGTQLFYGVQIPEGAEVLEVVTSGAMAVALEPQESWRQLLDSTFPAPAGMRWVGYATGQLGPSASGLAQVTARIVPPAGAASMPYATRVGVRSLDPEQPGDAINAVENFRHIGALAGTATDGSAALRDIALAAAGGGPVEVRRGQTASVPFVASYTGAAPSGPLPVTTTTTLPGATVAPDPNVLQLAATGTAPVLAKVSVPAGAPLGDHDVTASIPLVTGATRTATAKLRVVADPPAPAPAQAPPAAPAAPAVKVASGASKTKAKLGALVLGSTRRSVVLRDGLRFTQQVPTAGTVVWELRRGTTLLGRVTRKVTRAGKQTVTLKLTRAGKRAARRGRRAPVALKTTLTPTGQPPVTATKRLTLGR